MRRRGFFTTMISGAALGWLAGGCADAPVGGAISRHPPPLVRALGVDTVRQLGRRYAEQTPSERSVVALEQAIAESVRRVRRWWWSPDPSIDQLMAHDFSTGQTVFVDGWMLSVSEARHCALLALRQG